jgi:hypothetical protein
MKDCSPRPVLSSQQQKLSGHAADYIETQLAMKEGIVPRAECSELHKVSPTEKQTFCRIVQWNGCRVSVAAVSLSFSLHVNRKRGLCFKLVRRPGAVFGRTKSLHAELFCNEDFVSSVAYFNAMYLRSWINWTQDSVSKEVTDRIFAWALVGHSHASAGELWTSPSFRSALYVRDCILSCGSHLWWTCKTNFGLPLQFSSLCMISYVQRGNRVCPTDSGLDCPN